MESGERMMVMVMVKGGFCSCYTVQHFFVTATAPLRERDPAEQGSWLGDGKAHLRVMHKYAVPVR